MLSSDLTNDVSAEDIDLRINNTCIKLRRKLSWKRGALCTRTCRKKPSEEVLNGSARVCISFSHAKHPKFERFINRARRTLALFFQGT